MKQSLSQFRRRKNKLSQDTASMFEGLYRRLDDALLSKDREKASELAKELEGLSNEHLKKNLFEGSVEIAFALLFALLFATVVRQMWFELYEIPTGSMRPTFEELDRLTVTKTSFGINIPFMTDHFLFDPDLVQRTGVVIFSGDNIDLPDTEGSYLWIFPAKKRYIKRLIGKPGDTLYFYGGKIYGIDREGHEIEEYQNSPWMEHLEHIPFLSFTGRLEEAGYNELLFKQMDIPIGRIINKRYSGLKSEIFVENKWVEEKLPRSGKGAKTIENYSDYYGMGNFAMARLVDREQLLQIEGIDLKNLEEGVLYLELSHHPSLSYPAPLLDEESLRQRSVVNGLKTVIPLQENHLQTILDNIYTARFVVKNHTAAKYSPEGPYFSERMSPRLPNVPDGTYEFYFGKGSSVGMGGILSPLSKENPLYDSSPKNIQFLYNLGIDFTSSVAPSIGNSNNFPNRYAYFRDGDLYLLGVPLLKKDDPALVKFLERERERAENSLPRKPYIPFVDRGPPLKGGEIDRDFIKTFGVTVPDRHYLVLGDNHAMSADSRFFGFVPEQNLEGAPSLIIWPPGPRWGFPLQRPYPLFTAPRLIVWGIFGAIAIAAFIVYAARSRQRIYKE